MKLSLAQRVRLASSAAVLAAGCFLVIGALLRPDKPDGVVYALPFIVFMFAALFWLILPDLKIKNPEEELQKSSPLFMAMMASGFLLATKMTSVFFVTRIIFQ